MGVAYIDGAGQTVEVRADRVVLSAGAYGSAPILLRSGIGPAQELAKLGVDVVADLPVGRGLMDHPLIVLAFFASRETAQLGWPAHASFIRGDSWFGLPIALNEEDGVAGMAYCLATVDGPRGTVRLSAREPGAKPIIDHRYVDSLSDAFDGVWSDWQEVLATKTLRSAGVRDVDGDLPLAERVLGGLHTSAHPAGGCSIGKVVDPDLNVYGIEGLSVADASVFPLHVSNNPNLTCFMVGEAAAARIGASTSGRTAVAPA